jgi:leucyl aminopeptidase (aminopeptidase T)
MTTDKQLLAKRFSKILIEKMFQVKPGETIAITADTGSNKEVIDTLTTAASAAGGIPLVMWIPKAEQSGQAGMQYWPAEALTAALCKVDVWIDAQSTVILYSDIWETAFKENSKLRYLIIADSSIESLDRMFTGFDIQLLKSLLSKVRDMAMASKKVRITSNNGTNVSYDIDLNYAFDIDDGDFSMPKFGTAPGFINIVPKLGSMNGTIVFDILEGAPRDGQIQFSMKNGAIAEVNGRKGVAEFKSYLAAFEDENMYKISHNMFGLNPRIKTLTGELCEDERIWGGVDFGFGHTSAMDMPPYGQEAKSHFDGVVTNVSIYLDDIQIFDNGVVCHPDLIPLVNNLLTN